MCVDSCALILRFPLGEDGIKHLMSRGRHRFFGYSTLLVVLAWYGLGAAIVSGTAISSGE